MQRGVLDGLEALQILKEDEDTMNVRVGDKVPFARVGAQLIDGHTGELVRLKLCRDRPLGLSAR